MHYLFQNIKFLASKNRKSEDEVYESLGFSQEEVFSFVTASNNPSPDQLIKLSEYFNTPIDILIRKDLTKISEYASKNIQMLVVDVDGVLTDGSLSFSDSGLEFKTYNAKDGLALIRLGKSNIKTGMLSHGFNRALVKNRGEMLGVDFIYTGNKKKLEILEDWAEKTGIPLENIAFIGDDLNDMDALQACGFSACPADANYKVKEAVDYVLSTDGGRGCVREFADNFLSEYL
jgi:3-deoxy-D-manno-octulosonate 8-phosphate phosphatase (KDO 8-P phosphatase)